MPCTMRGCAHARGQTITHQAVFATMLFMPLWLMANSIIAVIPPPKKRN